MKRFLENIRAIKQSSSQQTTKYFFLVRSTKTRKSNIFLFFLFLKIDFELFRVIGLKYDNKSPPNF